MYSSLGTNIFREKNERRCLECKGCLVIVEQGFYNIIFSLVHAVYYYNSFFFFFFFKILEGLSTTTPHSQCTIIMDSIINKL